MSKYGVDYQSYLKLDQLLSCQTPLTSETSHTAHDELLFIIIHQAYELWFKQILWEVDSVLKIFDNPNVDEKEMGIAVARLERVIEIQRLLIDQINVLETMTPLDFLDFRDVLYPASGFQSFQFRVLENKLGLKSDDRLIYNHLPYQAYFSEEQQAQLKQMENGNSLFDCVEKWLARTPFLEMGEFDFWSAYGDAVQQMFVREREMIEKNKMLSEDDKQKSLAVVSASEQTFEALLDESKYQQLLDKGEWRLSYRALHAALFIQLYRDQPVLHLPFRLITTLLDMDENLTTWRYRHALMVKRMLGTKVGTGGSSGAKYLRASTEKHKVFSDFFQMTTFFIPRSALPKLPKQVEQHLGFTYEKNAK